MHHLFQTKKLLRDLRQSDFHSSAAQVWGDDLKRWAALSWAPPCPALLFLRQVHFQHQLDVFWQMRGRMLWLVRGEGTNLWFPLKNSQLWLFLLPHPKWAGWEDVPPSPEPSASRDHPSHSCGWGTERSKTFRFCVSQPKTSISQWKTFMERLSNECSCTGTAGVCAVMHFHSELVLQQMIYNYYPPGQHGDFFLQGYKGWDLNQHSGTSQIQTCNPISTDCKVGAGRRGGWAPSLCHITSITPSVGTAIYPPVWQQQDMIL